MVRFRSYRTRLLTALLLLGLSALAVTGWEASEGAASALQTATYDRLTAIRETRGSHMERYFDDLGNHVIALSSDESTITALEEFEASLTSLPRSVDVEALQERYNETFRETVLREVELAGVVQAWFPRDPVTLSLQHLFITRNPYPAALRFHQLSVPAAGKYGAVHARFHPTFHRYLSAFGFYDIFLITAAEGRLIYSVKKEVDLGVRLTQAPYSQTALAAAYRRALAVAEPETFVIEDYAPYLPSNAAPASFVAAPVYRAGRKIAILAIQLSIRDINSIMTGGGKWASEGLGRTGQSYVVDNDGTLRSDLRQELENPQEFYKELQNAGTSPDVLERIRRYGTAVLNLKVTPDVAPQGTRLATDFRGRRMLRSQAPLHLPDLTWTVVAEIEAAEALAPARRLRWRLAWQSLVTAALLAIAAYVLAGRVTRPLLRLAESARRLGKRDFGVRLPVDSEDELGQLAVSFNRMAEDLESTTVSKQEVDRILGSLINAVFVVESGQSVTPEQVLDCPVRRLNRAAADLLRAGEQEAAGVRLRDLVPPELIEPWRERLERLLNRGRLPAEAATLLAADQSRIPVLFSASWLLEEPGRNAGLVCVAQDITEWKTAQDRLRRMSKVFMDATDPIVVIDSHGLIADCNSEAERSYAWPADELRHRHISHLFPERKNGEVATLVTLCLSGEAIRNRETVQVDRLGREFPALVTLSLLTGESGEPSGIAAIAKDITDRKHAEEELRMKQRELEALTSRLITAQEEERSRLARELHDDLTQRLAAVAIEAGNLERMPSGDAERWRAAFGRIKREMAELSDHVHGLSRRLHPSTLDELGLVAAIESECRAFFERGGAPVDFQVTGELPALPSETQLALYRIVQESLRNILKHADADEVTILLHQEERHVQLVIHDNGVGFNAPAHRSHGGIGLTGMGERARLVGAALDVNSAHGKGTTIKVTLPHEKAVNTAG